MKKILLTIIILLFISCKYDIEDCSVYIKTLQGNEYTHTSVNVIFIEPDVARNSESLIYIYKDREFVKYYYIKDIKELGIHKN